MLAGTREAGTVAVRAVSVVTRASGGGDQPSGLVYAALAEHLGEGLGDLPVASGAWPAYDHVNVQSAVDVWLAAQSGTGRLLGLTGFRHRMFGLADLFSPGLDAGMAIGAVAQVELASGPGDEVRSCVQCGLYLVTDGDARTVLMIRGSDERGPQQDVVLEIASTVPGEARRLLAELRALALERNVYRGRVISFGGEVFGPMGRSLLSFHPRPTLTREHLVLPDGLLEGVERQIIGVARHRELLLAHGQHLKRGVLLYGAPGVGKTHTIRYLMGRLPETTVLMLSSSYLHFIQEACSVARTLQPSLLVVEDVDLIGEERGMRRPGNTPLLFQLLNEMDGLGEDVDVTFVLTTNRVDVLEPALAARPGRIDHAVEIPLPDAEGRRRLLGVYRGGLELDLAEPERVIERTEGVTASFIKELLRRAALNAADEEGAGEGRALRLTDAHLHAALDVLLDDRNRLTRVLLGADGSAPQEHRGRPGA
jgi:hypothetical protein